LKTGKLLREKKAKSYQRLFNFLGGGEIGHLLSIQRIKISNLFQRIGIRKLEAEKDGTPT